MFRTAFLSSRVGRLDTRTGAPLTQNARRPQSADGYDKRSAPGRASKAAKTPKPSPSLMGAMFGFFGRVAKAARAAIVGAVVGLTAIGFGATLDPIPTDTHSPAPVVQAADIETGQYVTQPGDNLSRIATEHGVDLKELKDANPQIDNPSLIHPGDVINIPSRGDEGPAYVVQSNDSLGQIATEHDTTTKTLLELNKSQIDDPNLIHPKQVLRLPVANRVVAAPGPTPEARPTIASKIAEERAQEADGTNEPEAPPEQTPEDSARPVRTVRETPHRPETTRVEEPEPVAQTKLDAPPPTLSAEAVRLRAEAGVLAGELRARSAPLRGDDNLRPISFPNNSQVALRFDDVVLSEGTTPHRDAYAMQQAQEGRFTAWFEGQGKLHFEAKASDGTQADYDLRYTMIRPLAYQSEDSERVLASFNENLGQLPTTADAARKMTQGSEFILEGDRELGTFDDHPESVGLKLTVARQEGDWVQVSYRRDVGIDTRFDEEGVRNGTLDQEFDTLMREQSFRFDLATEKGRASYEQLLSFKSSAAIALTRTSNNGVEAVADRIIAESPEAATEAAPTAATATEAAPEVEDDEFAEEPDTEGSVLVRAINGLVFSILEDEEYEVSKPITLGDNTEGLLHFEAAFLDSAGFDAERLAFERSQKAEGRRTIWVESEGTFELGSTRQGDNSVLSAEVELNFNLTRPFAYKKEDPAAVLKAFAENLTSPPLTHQEAAKMQRGASFLLSANAELAASKEFGDHEVSADADGAMRLSVKRLSGSMIEVSYRRNLSVDAELDANNLNNGTLDVDLDASLDRKRWETFRIDLDTTDGQEAYDALLSFKGSVAVELAENRDGVRLTESSEERGRMARLLARFKPSDEVQTGLRIEWEDNTEDGDRTRTLSGGVDARITPEGRDTTTELSLDLEREVTDEKTTRRAEAEVEIETELSDNTDLSVTSQVEFERVQDHEKDTETTRGSLRHEGELATELSMSDGSPLSLGFDAEHELNFELTTPQGANRSLPLRGLQMLAAEPGTRLELGGEGSVGFDAELEQSNTETFIGYQMTGRLDVDALRLEGDRVRVKVEVERSRENKLGVEWGDDREGQSTSLDFDHEGTREKELSATFELDLNDPEHREAYAALLRGHMSPAAALLEQDLPDWEVTTENQQQVELDHSRDDWLDLNIEFTRRDIDPNNWRIRWDSHRKATSDAAEADGQDIRWVEVQRGLTPKLNHRVSLPISGALMFRHGFSWENNVQFRALAPSIDGAEPNLSPALLADQALELPRGAEFVMQGRGKLGGFVGLGLGATVGEGTPVSAGITASMDTEHAQSRNWKVEVDRLDGDLVRVSLQETEDQESIFELAFRAGIEIDANIPGGENLETLDKILEFADEKFERRLAIELESSWNNSQESSSKMSLELDLSKPEARRAYEALLQLDGSVASRLVLEGQDSGVSLVSASVRNEESSEQLTNVEFFGKTLYLREALREDSTIIEGLEGEGKRTDASSYEERREGLLGRKRDIHWEAVRVRLADDPLGQGYYRLRFNDRDPLTSRTEVRRVVELAESLDAQTVREIRADRGARGIATLLADIAHHGKTTVRMDLFFTEDGIFSIRRHDGLEALQMYGAELAGREGRALYGWADPQYGARSSAIMDEYFEVKNDTLLDDKDKQSALRSIEVKYWRLTGTDMWRDRDPYEGAKAFSDMVDRMHHGEDPAEWNRAFADLGEAVGFSFYDAVATMQTMTGSDEVVVHRLEMKGHAVDIEMRDEGLLAKPTGRPTAESPSLRHVEADDRRLLLAVAGQESGHNYYGPTNKDAAHADGRGIGAIGKYQMLGENVVRWSRQAANKGLIRSEVADRLAREPEAIATDRILHRFQDIIAASRMADYADEARRKGHTGDDVIRYVASAWYSGDGDLMNSRRAQGAYPSIHAYTVSVLDRYNEAVA